MHVHLSCRTCSRVETIPLISTSKHRQIAPLVASPQCVPADKTTLYPSRRYTQATAFGLTGTFSFAVLLMTARTAKVACLFVARASVFCAFTVTFLCEWAVSGLTSGAPTGGCGDPPTNDGLRTRHSRRRTHLSVRPATDGRLETASSHADTPEVYPTELRATAVGAASAFARIGGMIAPFIGQVRALA